jgi:hypothetical protein
LLEEESTRQEALQLLIFVKTEHATRVTAVRSIVVERKREKREVVVEECGKKQKEVSVRGE